MEGGESVCGSTHPAIPCNPRRRGAHTVKRGIGSTGSPRPPKGDARDKKNELGQGRKEASEKVVVVVVVGRVR